MCRRLSERAPGRAAYLASHACASTSANGRLGARTVMDVERISPCAGTREAAPIQGIGKAPSGLPVGPAAFPRSRPTVGRAGVRPARCLTASQGTACPRLRLHSPHGLRRSEPTLTVVSGRSAALFSGTPRRALSDGVITELKTERSKWVR